MISFKPKKHRLRRASQFLGKVSVLALFVLVMAYACAEGIEKQEEINRQALYDQCRAEPETCDVPQHARR